MRKSRIKNVLYSQKIAPYVFILPFLLTFLIFFSYPIINSFVMSFQRLRGGVRTFVGLENYQKLNNPVFFKSVKNSMLYMVVSCLLLVPIPMVLANLLNSKFVRAKTMFRSIMFLPALTSVVVAGTLFRLMFGELDGSLMNQLIGRFGFEPLVWLRRPVTVWTTVFMLALWRWTGVNMVYYLAGLQQIPDDLFEAAEIDGANGIQRFIYITVPSLRSIIVFVLTISIYGGLAMFTETFILFNGNNSPNNVGTTIVGFLYRMGWEQNNIGLASAVGVILLVIVLGFNLVQLIITGAFRKAEV